jgi:hypothetical protein
MLLLPLFCHGPSLLSVLAIEDVLSSAIKGGVIARTNAWATQQGRGTGPMMLTDQPWGQHDPPKPDVSTAAAINDDRKWDLYSLFKGNFHSSDGKKGGGGDDNGHGGGVTAIVAPLPPPMPKRKEEGEEER